MFGNMLGFNNLFGFASMQAMDMISSSPCNQWRLSANQMWDDYTARQGLFLSPMFDGGIFQYGSMIPGMPDFTSSILSWGNNMQQALLNRWADPFAMNNGSVFGMGNMGGGFGFPGVGGMQSPWMNPGGTSGAQGGGSSDSGLSEEERIAKKNVEGYTKFLKELTTREDLLKNNTALKAKIEAAIDDCSRQVEDEDGKKRNKTYAEKLAILEKAFDEVKKAEPEIVKKYIKENTSIQLNLRGTNVPLRSALEGIGYEKENPERNSIDNNIQALKDAIDGTTDQSKPPLTLISQVSTGVNGYTILDLISSWNSTSGVNEKGLMETLINKYKTLGSTQQSTLWVEGISPVATAMMNEATNIKEKGAGILDTATLKKIEDLKKDLSDKLNNKNYNEIATSFNKLYILLRRSYIKIAQKKISEELEFLKDNDATKFLAEETEKDLKSEKFGNLLNDTKLVPAVVAASVAADAGADGEGGEDGGAGGSDGAGGSGGAGGTGGSGGNYVWDPGTDANNTNPRSSSDKFNVSITNSNDNSSIEILNSSGNAANLTLRQILKPRSTTNKLHFKIHGLNTGNYKKSIENHRYYITGANGLIATCGEALKKELSKDLDESAKKEIENKITNGVTEAKNYYNALFDALANAKGQIDADRDYPDSVKVGEGFTVQVANCVPSNTDSRMDDKARSTLTNYNLNTAYKEDCTGIAILRTDYSWPCNNRFDLFIRADILLKKIMIAGDLGDMGDLS